MNPYPIRFCALAAGGRDKDRGFYWIINKQFSWTKLGFLVLLNGPLFQFPSQGDIRNAGVGLHYDL